MIGGMMVRLARYVAVRLADPRRRPRTVFYILLLVCSMILAWQAVAYG